MFIHFKVLLHFSPVASLTTEINYLYFLYPSSLLDSKLHGDGLWKWPGTRSTLLFTVCLRPRMILDRELNKCILLKNGTERGG